MYSSPPYVKSKTIAIAAGVYNGMRYNAIDEAVDERLPSMVGNCSLKERKQVKNEMNIAR